MTVVCVRLSEFCPQNNVVFVLCGGFQDVQIMSILCTLIVLLSAELLVCAVEMCCPVCENLFQGSCPLNGSDQLVPLCFRSNNSCKSLVDEYLPLGRLMNICLWQQW